MEQFSRKLTGLKYVVAYKKYKYEVLEVKGPSEPQLWTEQSEELTRFRHCWWVSEPDNWCGSQGSHCKNISEGGTTACTGSASWPPQKIYNTGWERVFHQTDFVTYLYFICWARPSQARFRALNSWWWGFLNWASQRLLHGVKINKFETTQIVVISFLCPFPEYLMKLNGYKLPLDKYTQFIFGSFQPFRVVFAVFVSPSL